MRLWHLRDNVTRSRACAPAFLVAATLALASPSPAAAFNPIKPVCAVAGFVSGLFGKACSVVQHAGRLVAAGKKLATGHVGSAVSTVLGQSSGVASKATTALALAAVGAWVLGGAKFVLHETTHVIAATTSPRLTSSWFSATYWRVAGIAAVLTLPFLFAAAVQALLSSDVSLLFRAALGYLPLAMLAVSVAAPVTMLLLAASDQLAAIVSSAAGHDSAHFLDAASGSVGGVVGLTLSPFIGFFIGLVIVAVALALWLELLVRDAAVYVVVLMLPLTFAAFVWPARRVWAIRTVELLLALILSKFVIVAVLSLGGAALGQSVHHSITGLLAGGVLLLLAALAPWTLLRLLPMAEVASAAAGSLRSSARAGYPTLQRADARATESHDWASRTAHMKRSADELARGVRETQQPEPPTGAGPPSTVQGDASTASPGADQVDATQADMPSQQPAGEERAATQPRAATLAGADAAATLAGADAAATLAGADAAATDSSQASATPTRAQASPPPDPSQAARERDGATPVPPPGWRLKTSDTAPLRLHAPQEMQPPDNSTPSNADAFGDRAEPGGADIDDPTPAAQPRPEGTL